MGDAAVYLLGTLQITGVPGYIEQNVSTGLSNIIEAAYQGEVKAIYDYISIWKNQAYEGVSIEINDGLFGKTIVSIAEKTKATEYGANWAYAYAAWAYTKGKGVAPNEDTAQKWIARLPKEMREGAFIMTLTI